MASVSVYTDLVLRADSATATLREFESQLQATIARMSSQTVTIAAYLDDTEIHNSLDQIRTDAEASPIEVSVIASDGLSTAIDTIRTEQEGRPIVIPVEAGDDEDGGGGGGAGAGGGAGGFRAGMMGRLLAGMFARHMIHEAMGQWSRDSEFNSDGEGVDPTAAEPDQLKELKKERKAVEGQFSGVSGWVRNRTAERAQGRYAKIQDQERAAGVPVEKIPDEDLPEKDQLAIIDKKIAEAEKDNKRAALNRKNIDRQQQRDEKTAGENADIAGDADPDQSELAKKKRELRDKLNKELADLDKMANLPAEGGQEGYARAGFQSQKDQQAYVVAESARLKKIEGQKEADATKKDSEKTDKEIDADAEKRATAAERADERLASEKKRLADEISRYEAEASKSALGQKKNDIDAEMAAFNAAWDAKIQRLKDPEAQRAAGLARDAGRLNLIGNYQDQLADTNAKAQELELQSQHKPLTAQLDAIERENAKAMKEAGSDTTQQAAQRRLANARLDEFKQKMMDEHHGSVTSLDAYTHETLSGGGSKSRDDISELLNRANKDKAGSSGQAATADAWKQGVDKWTPAVDVFKTASDSIAAAFKNPIQLAVIT